MLVFRVEKLNGPDDPIGLGAWRSSMASRHDCAAYDAKDGKLAEDMPMPSQEPEHTEVYSWWSRTGGNNKWVFGFATVKQYTDAFNSPSGRQAMNGMGGVSVYDVPDKDVKPGTAQVVFDPSRAKRLAVLPCTIEEEYHVPQRDSGLYQPQRC